MKAPFLMSVSRNDAALTPAGNASPASVITATLLIRLSLINVYRAVTQSVVYDEAFTYLAFLAGSPSRVFTEYTANNHVLFSLLARLTTGMFGLSELTLRLPTVVAGVVHFGTVFALCRRVFGNGLLFVVTVAALSMNPFILDFMSAARGYGMALAFFLIALYQLTQSLFGDDLAFDRRWLVASLALALSVSANLTFLAPALALACVALLTGVSHDSARRRFVQPDTLRRGALWFCAPGIVVAGALLLVPLSHARAEHFFFGANTLSRTLTSLVEASFHHDAGAWPISSPDIPSALMSRAVAWGLVVPTLLLIAGAVCLSIIRTLSAENRRRLDRTDRFCALVGGTLVLTLLLLVGAHVWLDVPYPFARTGLYFIPLFVLAMAALVQKLRQSAGGGRPVLAGVLLAMLSLSVGRFATEFDVTYYYEWRYDAGTRSIFNIIARWPRAGDSGTVEVAAQRWLFSPSLNFYRVARHNQRVAPIGDGWDPEQGNHDFFVVAPGADLERARRVGNVVYTDPVSGVVLLSRTDGRPPLPSPPPPYELPRDGGTD